MTAPASAPLLTITIAMVTVPYWIAGAPGSKSLEGNANTMPWWTTMATAASATAPRHRRDSRVPSGTSMKITASNAIV